MSKLIGIGEQIVKPRRMRAFSLVASLDAAFGLLAGSLRSADLTAEERIARRAANDAAQR